MKVVIAGATGFIGQEALRQCIEHPSITSIVVLSRRQLTRPETSPKVKVVVLDDFLEYSPSTLSEIQGAGACIWALGKPYIPDNDEARRVSLDYTLAAARAFTEQQQHAAAGDGRDSKFRFIYMSGKAVQRDQTKSLWFLSEYRKMRGQVEQKLLEHAKENPAVFESYILRPGFVLKKDFNFVDVARSLAPSVRLEALGRVVVDIALNGCESDTLENKDIVERSNTAVKNL